MLYWGGNAECHFARTNDLLSFIFITLIEMKTNINKWLRLTRKSKRSENDKPTTQEINQSIYNIKAHIPSLHNWNSLFYNHSILN